MSDSKELWELGQVKGAQDERERIIDLLEKMSWQVYVAVSTDGKPIESVKTPKTLIRDDVIALIKGDK